MADISWKYAARFPKGSTGINKPHEANAFATPLVTNRRDAKAKGGYSMVQSQVPHLITNGRALEQRKRYDEALAFYDRILANAPNDLEARQRRAWVLIQLKRNDDALAALDHALALDPGEAWTVALKAKTLHRLGRLTEAHEAADRAIELAPDYVYAHMTKSYIARALKNDDEALLHAARALELDPDNAEAAEQQAAALYRLHRFEESLPFFELAERLDPKDGSPCFWRGRALDELGRYEEALSAYARAQDLDPDSPRVWHWKAIALRQLTRHEEALTALHETLKREPTNAQAYRDIAFSLGNLNRREESLAACQKSIELQPDDYRARYTLAAALYECGRYDEAVDAWQRTIELSAENSITVPAWRWSADALLRLKRYDEAIQAASEAIGLAEDDATAWRIKAEALTALDRREPAIIAVERAVALKPNDPDVRAAQVRVLLWAGHYDEALLAAEHLVSLQPDKRQNQEYLSIAHRALHRETQDKTLILRDGRRLEYIELGDPDGIPIIALHGTPGSRLDWDTDDTILRELRLRVIAPDRPGYGHSHAKRHMRLLDFPSDICELADHLGLSRFAVVGYSGGAPYAMACAIALKDRVAGLGLVSSGPPGPGLVAKFPFRARLKIRVAQWLPKPLYRALHVLTAHIACADPAMWAETATRRASASGVHSKSTARLLSPADRERITERYRQGGIGHFLDGVFLSRPLGLALTDIAAPTYVWHGEKDMLAPPIIGHYLANQIPNCHATFYPDEGHSLLASHLWEIFAALAEAVKRDMTAAHDGI